MVFLRISDWIICVLCNLIGAEFIFETLDAGHETLSRDFCHGILPLTQLKLYIFGGLRSRTLRIRVLWPETSGLACEEVSVGFKTFCDE